MKRKRLSNLYYVVIATIVIASITVVASAQTNTGIATITPTERLDIGSGNVRIRDVNTIAGNPVTDKVLVADATGVVKSVSGTNLINIYTSNGTLTGNRTVTQGANTLTFTGTAASMVKLTNIAGTAATPVPALQIVDGSQAAGKVLTSDANGNTSWTFSALKAIPGNLPTSVVSFTSYGAGNPPNINLYTGGSIILPPGKWMVSFGSIASMGQNDRINTTDAQLWCTCFLSDSNTGTGTVTADYITAYTGQRGSGGSIGRGMNRTMVAGSIAINNTTAANKTYYLWANQEFETAPSGPAQITINNGNNNPGPGYWVGVFGNGNWERYFYAIPIQ